MRIRRFFALFCTVVILVSALGGMFTFSAPDDTIYVKKHVSLVYDNSGSMSMELENTENLKWTYASYAAQAFAGLLNDTDTLNVSFMESAAGSKTMELDMSGNRQEQINKFFNATKEAEGDTPWEAVQRAVDNLVDKGLLTDDQTGNNEVSKSEQYWLVLTTDGVFDKKTPEQTVEDIKSILDKYSNLQVVYFGIGTENDASKYAAKDLRNDPTLTAYSNFTAEFAQQQSQIVSIMQKLANRVSGRYSVTSGLKIRGNTATLRISGESSPIRNIAILAQETDVSIVDAKDSKGNTLKVSRDVSIDYPRNPDYDNISESTKGGYIALITSDSGKIQPGTVTLTFSENINGDKFSLMYEPAVYVDITIETKDDDGQWVTIPYGQKIDGSRPVRVSYTVCEDGTDTPIDPEKLPGASTASITCGDEEIEIGKDFDLPNGNTAIKATVSLMDGAYTVSAVRNITVISLDGYTYKVSDPLEFYPDEIGTNTSRYIDFEISYEGKTASADQLTEFSIDAGELQGKFTANKKGVLRFTPTHSDCPVGEYTVNLCFQGKTVASQKVTVKEKEISFTAVAGESLALFSNQLASNTTPVVFTVTKHMGPDEEYPLTTEDVGLFTAEAKNADGAVLKGSLTFKEGGELHFTPYDENSAVGNYDVDLIWNGKVIASSQVSILQYDATYTAEVFTVGDGKINRLKLRGNKSALAFVIYADGKPCPGTTLESMLSGVITLSSSPKNKGAKLDVKIGDYEGKPAIIVTPTSKGKTAFGAWIRNLGIVWGASVANGDYDITLTLNAPKGTEITGTLNVYQNFIDFLLWILIPVIILVIIGFVLRVLYANSRMAKIAPGTFYKYLLYPEKTSEGTECVVNSQKSFYHKKKFFLTLNTKKAETFTFDSFTIVAKRDYDDSERKYGYPTFTLKTTYENLSSYYLSDTFNTVTFVDKVLEVNEGTPAFDFTEIEDMHLIEINCRTFNLIKDISGEKPLETDEIVLSDHCAFMQVIKDSDTNEITQVMLWTFIEDVKNSSNDEE